MDISTRRLSVPGKPGVKATGLTQKSQVILLLAIATHFNCQNLTEFYIDESSKTQSRRLSGNHAHVVEFTKVAKIWHETYVRIWKPQL